MEEIKNMLIQLMEGQEAMKIDIGSVKNDIKKIDFKIEELDKKVDFSLEGHKTNTEQLNRIENEVTKQQEIILRKVK
ncbi:MAG: hypothetical protein ACREVX_00760 [Clostridium sp.]|uniref:hypothetical protein n=1 Tax=Clostridium sp. TaxID=1506 RepID=UPI003D6C98DD